MKIWCSLIFFILLFTSTLAQKKAPSLTWQVAALLPPPENGARHLGVAGALTGVHNNVLIVAGGANFPEAMPWMSGPKKYHDDVYIFNKGPKGKLKVLQTAKLPVAIGYAASCSTPAGIVCAGGENNQGLTNKVWLLQWTGETLEIKDLPQLPEGLTNAALTYSDGILYLAGGETATVASRQFLFLDMKNTAKGWQPLPALPQPTSHAVIAVGDDLSGKTIYLLGGRSKTASGISLLYDKVYAFNLEKGVWQEKASLPYALSAGTGTIIDNRYILLFGGDRGETFHKTEKLIAAINAEKDAVKKEALNKEKAQLQSGHPGFSKDVLLYDIEKNEWQKQGTIPFEAAVTTTAVQCGNAIYIPSGEIKAGVRTPQILKGEFKLKKTSGVKGN